MEAPLKYEIPDSKHIIVGAGPAGLTAALTLEEAGENTYVMEASGDVGGIARTERYKGYRFDIGGHRFFTKVGEVEQFWNRLMGDDFITVRRLSRIFYDGKYYDYPLRISNTLGNLGLLESVRIGLSYINAKLRPTPSEETFDQWVSNRFGRRLYQRFFETYTEKVWGIPCSRIRADWAAQRIQNLSLMKAVRTALFGGNDTTSLIEEFQYPRLGPGMLWERVRDNVIAHGGKVDTRTRVDVLHHDGEGHINAVTATDFDGSTRRIATRSVINTMPLGRLVTSLDPPAPQHVLDAAHKLTYRDFLIVVLIVDEPDPFPDNWIYIHSPDVQVGRIQNFRSWSQEMVPHENRSSIGMEYFCHVGDGLWDADDQALIEQASSELESLGLVNANNVIDGTVIRQPKAYPVYDEHYSSAVGTIRDYIKGFDNLQSVGRNGMHRYNNQDHSMLTAMLAARNILGENHDAWNVNVERSYHEEFVTSDSTSILTPSEMDDRATQTVPDSASSSAAAEKATSTAYADTALSDQETTSEIRHVAKPRRRCRKSRSAKLNA